MTSSRTTTSSRSYQVEEAKQFAKIIGHPAPAWEIKDLDGRTHTLEQYRGKVLVLDFWYRGCGWCMRAMPQVKRIASALSGRPVAVFGMNNDRNEDDAKFVVQKMQLDYPVLRSDEIPGKYGVQRLPDPDHHRPAREGRRHPRRLLAASLRGGEVGRRSPALIRSRKKRTDAVRSRGPRHVFSVVDGRTRGQFA